MTNNLKPEELEIINDETTRWKKIQSRLALEIKAKAIQLKDNQEEARRMTAEIVNTQREEEKQALQSDEYVAHGLARLRLEQTNSLSQLVEQPYFARVIYNEGVRDVEFKLGVASYPEERIIDWRKGPISKLYYDYSEGDIYEEEIMGQTRTGEIKTRRGLSGRFEILSQIDLKDSSYVLSRGSWHKQKKFQRETFSLKDREKIRELMNFASDQDFTAIEREHGYLPQILSLITPEQFRLISAETTRPVIIQGAAGTGKTTVALHRLAWLLYDESSEKNNQFASKQDSKSQTINARDKLSAQNTMVLVFSPTLAKYVRQVLPDLGIPGVRIATFNEWARDVLQTMIGQTILITHHIVPEQLASLKSRLATFETLKNFVASQPKEKNPVEILFDFFKTDFFSSLAGKDQLFLTESLREKTFDPYDLAFLLEIIFTQRGYFQGKRFPASFDHLIIDEAQDFTIGEIRTALHALKNNNQLTIAGDLGQKILEHRDFGTWSDLLKEIGMPEGDVISLQVSYRSTYQIYELAEAVRIPEIDVKDIKMVPKFGPEPLLTLVASYTDTITFARSWIEDIATKNHYAIGAIICKTPNQARDLFNSLIRIGTRGIRLGDAVNFEFTPGFTITDVRQVKGLEFPYVLIFDPSEENYPEKNLHAQNQLYVAITRAEFKLDFVAFNNISSLLPHFIQKNDLTAEVENVITDLNPENESQIEEDEEEIFDEYDASSDDEY